MNKHRLFIDPERRTPNFNNSYSSLDDLPPGTVQQVIGLHTSDGAATVGVLHRPAGGTRTCAVYMHPRTNQTRPYLAPALLQSGIAVWGQMSRHVNNDSDMTHEEVLLDLAAGMRWLRAQGFERIIAIGNSGGSSLAAYYQSQASQARGARLKTSPAGEPTGFDTEEMPEFDLYIALALHIGEGAILLRLLDPAVVDEGNPIATDKSLDMFSAANGYRALPEPSQYDADWVATYRSAQVARCKRLDAIARGLLDDYREARQFARADLLDTATARRAMFARVMTVHRTCADPKLLDPGIDPNRRPLGHHNGEHPIRVNLGFGGHARVITPRAWLSTWSGLSSNAALAQTIRNVTIPSLFIYPDADHSCTPQDLEDVVRVSGARDKQAAVVEWGLHYLSAAPGMPEGLASPKVRAGDLAVRWIKERI
ncbi:MAG TPA: alpha/beta hydrolase [Burkholderiaceae bacterium]|nr:alpha/beta hydrolase [Burkholderiaceae bacterium]